MFCAFYVIADRAKAERLTQKKEDEDSSLLDSLPGPDEGNKDSDSDSGVGGNGAAITSDDQFSPFDNNDTDPLIVPVQVHNGAGQIEGRRNNFQPIII